MNSNIVSWVLLSFFAIENVRSESENKDDLALSASFYVEHFRSIKTTFTFVNTLASDHTFVDEFLKDVQADFGIAVNVKSVETLKEPGRMNTCVLVVAKTTAGVNDFLLNLPHQSHNVLGFYLVVILEETNSEDFVEISQLASKLKLANFKALTRRNNTTIVTTFVPLSRKCSAGNENQENFRSQDFEPTRENAFAKNIKDLKRCPIKASTFELPPFVMIKEGQLIGRDIQLINTISEALQVEIEIDVIDGDIPWGYLYANGTGTGAIAKLLNNESDIIFGDYFLKLDRLQFFDASQAYLSSKLIFLIPAALKLTSIEKLLQPYGKDVWIAVTVSCTLGALIVLKLKTMSPFVWSVAFGANVSSPLTNMIQIVLGSGVPTLPLQTFPRFILAMFVLFCMIMRCSYEGSLFKFLQSDGSVQQIRSFDDIIEKNYRIFIGKSFRDLIQPEDELYNR